MLKRVEAKTKMSRPEFFHRMVSRRMCHLYCLTEKGDMNVALQVVGALMQIEGIVYTENIIIL